MQTLQQHIDRLTAKIAEAEEKIQTASGSTRKNLVKKICGRKKTLRHLLRLSAWGIVKN